MVKVQLQERERGPFICSSVLDFRWRKPGRCSGEKPGSETHEPCSPIVSIVCDGFEQ